MGGKRIIVDREHAIRQHKAFAVMVIVLLLAVAVVWFIQIRLAVRDVDLSKVRDNVRAAQEALQGAFVTDASVSAEDNVDEDAGDDADALTTPTVSDDVRNAIGAKVVEELREDSTEVPAAAEDAEMVSE